MILNNNKILIAQPDPRMLMRLEMIAREEDLDIVTCKDGLDAYQLAKKLIPKLMVIDINLSGLDVFHLCRLIKFDDKYRNIKILLLLNVKNRELMEKGEKVRIDDFLVKPFTDESILSRIQMGMGKCKLKQQKVIWFDTR